ncbi:MAG: hypothetical protein LBV51_02000 [Acholeplasmatales bacterium]|jgi:hypothetical protein|nr:hypothetical protein [Acholeplasmatales bacterium]
MQTQQNIFSKQIDYLIKYYKDNGNYDKYEAKRLLILDSIPQVLKDIGFRGDNLTLSVTKFFGILEKHSDELNENILKQLPDKLANPLAIIKSKKRADSIVMIIDLDNEYGHKLIVPISLQNNHSETDVLGVTRAASINILSTYGNNDNYDSRAIELLEYAVKNKEVIYINNDSNVYDILEELVPDIVFYKKGDLYDFKNNEAKNFNSQNTQYTP